MLELKLYYDELVEMSLENAKKIMEEFDNEQFLEDIVEEVAGTNYGVKVLDEGKCQYMTDVGVLCEYDEKWNIVKMFDIADISQITRSRLFLRERCLH